jgi:hypothetical protein
MRLGSGSQLDPSRSWKEVAKVAKGSGGNGSGKQGRSAITGRYVKQSTVRSHPKTTVNESKKKGK